jgi:hypothetical protein
MQNDDHDSWLTNTSTAATALGERNTVVVVSGFLSLVYLSLLQTQLDDIPSNEGYDVIIM